jgi:hypothetical protein
VSKVLAELSKRAQQCGLTVVCQPHGQYSCRAWDGVTVGPMTPRDARMWISGYAMGQGYHELGCQCGRVACVHRAANGRGGHVK